MSQFREDLARSESGGRYGVVNPEGYTGKYQFGPARLTDYMRATGTMFTMDQFRKSPELQESVQRWHEGDILNYVAANELDRFIGQVVGGVKITPQSMLGMAHLGGKAGMRKFLETGGEYNPEDSNGTSLRDYGQKFSGQDRSAEAVGTRPSVLVPQAKDKAGLNAITKGIEALASDPEMLVGRHKSPNIRQGVRGQMSPLSSLGIPGAGKYVNYSVPMGGIGSLKG